jgi:phosphatidylserine/phosphatidylglycerophosphate/cardiolipin synthase-like enzyme
MDNRSLSINNEVAVGAHDTLLARSLEDTFRNDLKKSKQIKLDEWKKRGLWQRWCEIYDRKFVEQY